MAISRGQVHDCEGYLLDTHTFLWAIGDSPKLSASAAKIFLDGSSRLVLSAASTWEIAIKVSLGKLTLRDPLHAFLQEQIELNAIEVLPISFNHTLRVRDLPRHHGDPFDRLIVVQAQTENLMLVSADAVFARYDVKCVW